MYKTLLLLLICFTTSLAAQAETINMREALVLGLSGNYDLEIANLDVERSAAGALGEEGRFDVTAELDVSTSQTEIPAEPASTAVNKVTTRQSQAELALGKAFATGLQGRLSMTGTRNNADSLADELDPAYRTTMVLDLTQPLLKNLGHDVNTTKLRIARINQRQAAYGYLSRAQQLAAEIENAYLDLAQAEEDYRYATLARDLARELLDGNQRKLDAGLIPVTEVNEARAAVASREEAMLLSQQRIAITRNRLVELITQGETGAPDEFEAALPRTVSISEPSLENALETGLQNRPDLRQARLELDARELAVVYADNQRLPQLDLEASLGLNGLAGQGDGSSSYAGEWTDAFASDGHSWYAGMRFTMPLQNRTARAQYLDAKAQDRQALLKLRRAEIAAETEIRSAHKTLELGAQRLEVARRAAELARATFEQENRRLQEGLSDTFRLLIIQSSLVAARVSEVAALTDYHRASAELYRATGKNLERYDIAAVLPHQGAMP